VAENEHQEIIIIKRHAAPEEGHHGGAWKIAFADFMTALMALFLVLWLVGSASDKTKISVARYFNPVKLVDMTSLKKGFKDPVDEERSAGDADTSATVEAEDKSAHLVEPGPKKGRPDGNAKVQKRSEAELFSNPYLSLTEIAAAEPVDEPQPMDKVVAGDGAVETKSLGSPDLFHDPFASVAAMAQAEAKAGRETRTKPAPAVASPSKPVAAANSTLLGKTGPADQTPVDTQINGADAVKVLADIRQAIEADAALKAIPQIEVEVTREGLLISLTDDAKFSMFAIGSAEPQAKTIEVMAKVAGVLKARPGFVVIRGHTDGRPYKSAVYDNWRLSSARAHMAQYMLIRGGLEERRIEKVEGYADHHLKNPNNPEAMENRRIEILLRKEKP
jgi:chemotaxis protein MotB